VWSPTVGDYCHVWITERFFAWRRAPLRLPAPILSPWKCWGIPLSTIRYVEVESTDLASNKVARIYWDAGESELAVFEFWVGMLRGLVKQFRYFDIPVLGEEIALSWRGAIRDYFWYCYFFIVFIGGSVILTLTAQHDRQHLLRNGLLYMVFLKVFNLWIYICIAMRKRKAQS
jgi:hypothetical protein